MYARMIGITIHCPVLDRDVISDSVSIEGGCVGHYGEDEYCYCESPYLEVKCECKPKGKARYHYVSIW